jgi:hypothetical protein
VGIITAGGHVRGAGLGNDHAVRTAIRIVAGLFALLWMVPGFGIIDLEVTISPTQGWLPVAMLEAGWGLLATFFIAGGFALVAIRPKWTVEISLQLLGLAALVAVSGALGNEPTVWWMVLALVIPAGILVGLASVGRLRGAMTGSAEPRSRPRWALAVLAAVGAGPWLAYAADMYAANREDRPPSEITNDVHHWPIQGAFAVALVLFTVLASLRPSLRGFNVVRVGVCAAYFGICSLRFPGVAAAVPAVWSVLAVVWGVLVAAAGSSRIQGRRRASASVTRAPDRITALR